jgi:hypothetical protein
VSFSNTVRLVPSKYRPGNESVLADVALDGDLKVAFELDDHTNDRLQADFDLLPGIGPHELVYRIPFASVINAAFTHTQPEGSRFNGPDRGAWYAGMTLRVSQAEVIFHHTVSLVEVGVFEDELTYDEYLADFTGEFHDLRTAPAFRSCLDPNSYMRSQELAERLLASSSLGIVYPSVRLSRGTCLACFRPALVTNVRRGHTHRYTWSGSRNPGIEQIS